MAVVTGLYVVLFALVIWVAGAATGPLETIGGVLLTSVTIGTLGTWRIVQIAGPDRAPLLLASVVHGAVVVFLGIACLTV